MAQKAKKKSKLFISGVPDYPLLVITMLLLMFGLVMLLSASAPSSLSEMGTSYYYFWRQLMFAGAGLVLMIICMKFNYRLLDNKVARIFFYVLSLVMAASVLVFGNSSGGATRWVRVGPISFQPSEVIKLALILFYASYLPTLKERVQKQNGFWRKYFVGFLMPLIYLGVVLIAVFKFQNHLSVCVLVTAITCVQMFVSGVKIRQFVITLAVLAAVGLMVWGCYSIVNSMTETTVQEDAGFNFRSERIKVWLDPDSNLTGTGWQINQSFYAIASGELLGVGLGDSNQKNLYLPEPHNDFIFAVVAEELGFIGAIVVILLFGLFIWRGLIISMNAPDMFSTLIAIGVTALIGLEAIINIAVVTGTIPVTGMLLPFFSYGGSSLVINLVAVGFLLAVSKS